MLGFSRLQASVHSHRFCAYEPFKLSRHLLALTGPMDLLTIIGLVEAVEQLIHVTSKVVNYFNDVKDPSKACTGCCTSSFTLYRFEIQGENLYRKEERVHCMFTTQGF